MINKNKKIRWIKLVSRRHCVFRIDLLDRGTAIKVKEKWGIDYGDQMFVSSPKLNAWFCNKEKIDKFGDFILTKVKNENGFADKIALATERSCLDLVKVAKETVAGNLKKLSNKQLASRLKKYSVAHYNFCAYFDVSNSIKDIGTQKIREGLMRLLKSQRNGKLFNDYIDELLKPEKNPLTNQEQIELRKISANDEETLKKHTRKYEWLSIYNPDDHPLPLAYFRDRINDLPQENTGNKQLNKLVISKELQGLIKLMKKYIYLHTFRAEMLSKSYFLIQPFLNEIATRWEIDLASVCALTAQEIIVTLEEGILPDFAEIENRKKSYLHLMKNNACNIYSGKVVHDKFLKEIGIGKGRAKKSKTIKGMAAAPGFVQGRVRIICNINKLEQIRDGEILVAPMTSPGYVSAMQKAAAVVTDEGSLLCHAAIICREMGKPCVVGTKIATSILKNGDLAQVDAYKGIVKIIKNNKQ